MKNKTGTTWMMSLCIVLLLYTTLAPAPSRGGFIITTQAQTSSADVASKSDQAARSFQERVKEYVSLRERLEEKLPKLSKDAKPEEIESHKEAFQGIVRAARAEVTPGYIFTPEIAANIRAAIKREFKGQRLQALRETVLEAETKGVPLRINYPYPEAKELAQIPPTLLLILPQLPKQVKYRFVGRHILLVDRENGLIIDYMPDALPKGA